jgi:hypothetical protein
MEGDFYVLSWMDSGCNPLFFRSLLLLYEWRESGIVADMGGL